MTMTVLLLSGLLSFSALVSPAYADGSRCIIGGRYRQSDVEKAFAEQHKIQSVTITKSKWSSSAMNPASWILDWDIDYRIMSLVVSDGNETQTFTDCKAYYTRNDQQLTFANCGDDIVLRLGRWKNYATAYFGIDLSKLPKCESAYKMPKMNRYYPYY